MTTLIRRITRYLGLDGNPLRRTSDRVESLARIALLSVLLSTGPAIAWDLGHAVYRDGVRVERADERDRLRTVAVLTDSAEPDSTRVPTRVPHIPRALARWTAPDGTEHAGRIPLRFGTDIHAGATVPVWLDPRTGQAVDPPREHAQTLAQTVAAALGTPLVMILLTAGLQRALRRALDRRRFAHWQAAWVLVEPGWSRRRG